MKLILLSVLVLFLVVNVGVLYYIVLFGDVAEFSAKLDVLERRVDSLILRDGSVGEESVVLTKDALVVLSDQQKDEIVELAAARLDDRVTTLVDQRTSSDFLLAEAKGQQVGEFFIPLGGATVKTSDYGWTNVPVESDFDLAKYGSLKRVTFEATLAIPTSNGWVEARLWDSVTGPVPGSEIRGEGSDGQFAKSSGLVINSGKRTLRVQMRTSLNFDGVMSNARLRIETN